jgi:hypothetical protein
MPAKPLTTEHHSQVHWVATTLVNDFIVMMVEFCGVEHHRPPEEIFEAAFDGCAYAAVGRGEVEGIEAINLLRKEMLKLTSTFERMEVVCRHDWANARGREPIRWKGQIYNSGYGALYEIFSQVKDVLSLCWLTEEELNELCEKAPPDTDFVDLHVAKNQQTVYEALKKIEGDADLLDLLVYAEQEYAILHKEAEEHERSKQPENTEWFAPASEFVDGVRFKDIHAVKRFLKDHPEIQVDKPSPKRLNIHAGQFMKAKKAEKDMAFKAEGEQSKAMEEYLLNEPRWQQEKRPRPGAN